MKLVIISFDPSTDSGTFSAQSADGTTNATGLRLVHGAVKMQMTSSHFLRGLEFSRRPMSPRVSGVAGGERATAICSGCNALVKGQDFSSLRLQGGTARILRSEIGSEGSELFQLR